MATPKKSAVKVSEIQARVGGKDLVFSIPRERLEQFEMAIGEPAAVRFKRIAGGLATAAQVRDVIELAAPAGLGRKMPTTRAEMEIAAAMRHLSESGITRVGPSGGFIAKAIAAKPPARFTVLAQGILAACLYGIPEDAAKFDDEEEDGDDAA